MLGYTIKYTAKDNKNRVLINHALLGRLMYKYYRGRKTAYYFPGMLDNEKYAKILEAKIFVEHLDFIDRDELNILGEIQVEQCERDETGLLFETAREHWYRIAKERGVPVHVSRSKKRK